MSQSSTRKLYLNLFDLWEASSALERSVKGTYLGSDEELALVVECALLAPGVRGAYPGAARSEGVAASLVRAADARCGYPEQSRVAVYRDACATLEVVGTDRFPDQSRALAQTILSAAVERRMRDRVDDRRTAESGSPLDGVLGRARASARAGCGLLLTFDSEEDARAAWEAVGPLLPGSREQAS